MLRKVAIVDDDQQFADMLALLATNAGLETQVYTNAQIFCQTPHDADELIILDLCMPDMDGIDVLRQLAAQANHCPLILISGQYKGVLRAAEDLAVAQRLNHLASLTKPVQLSELNAVLLKHLDGAWDHKERRLNAAWEPSVHELLGAIENHQLCLHYQPQIDLRTRALVGLEALVRWPHPHHGMIPPASFVPFAEARNLMKPLTDWVLAAVVAQAAKWQAEGADIRIAANISAANVAQVDFPSFLRALFEGERLNPQQLILEITESSVMTESVLSLDVLTRLRMKGFALSIDDFGTGYSTLAQLHRIPFNELKIDRSFVMTLLKDNDSRTIVETCISLGHKLGMQVVAEGVEDAGTLNMLCEMGCDFAQGYYIGKPMPADAIDAWREQWARAATNN